MLINVVSLINETPDSVSIAVVAAILLFLTSQKKTPTIFVALAD